MRKNRAVRRLVGMAAAAMISLGVAAPIGFAQDANYGEQPPAITGSGSGGVLGAPAAPGTPQRRAQLRLCIAKAQTKFGDNRPRMKTAIKKCKKRYG